MGELLRSWDMLFWGTKWKEKSVYNKTSILFFGNFYPNICRLRWYTKTTAVHKQGTVSITFKAQLMTWETLSFVHASHQKGCS